MSTQEKHDHIALIARVLDGESTPEDRAALAALRAEDPGVSTLFDELVATEALIQRLPMVEPPPHLRSRIMAALPADRYAHSAERRSLPGFAAIADYIRGITRARPAFALAYAVILGAALGMGGFAMLVKGGPEVGVSSVIGTLAPSEDLSALHTIGRATISIGDISGEARIATEGDRVFLELHLDSSSPADVITLFDAQTLRWTGIHHLRGAEHQAVASSPGRIHLSFSGGGHYLFSFEGSAAAPHFTLDISESGGSPSRLILAGR